MYFFKFLFHFKILRKIKNEQDTEPVTCQTAGKQ